MGPNTYWLASSMSANARQMKAMRRHAIDAVSRMFQLSWVKYLGHGIGRGTHH